MTAASPSADPAGRPHEGGEASEPSEPDISIEVPAGDWNWCAEHLDLVRSAIAAALERCSYRRDIAEPPLTVALSDDACVRALNRQFRGHDKPTNVLSFPSSPAPAIAGSYLGDIILAEETVLTEAADQGKPPLHHLLHLCVHGTLHLLGHDHEADEAAERMERMEIEILADLGIADPYA